jgi:hypothetical protein
LDGSATFVVDRGVVNDSSSPTDLEVNNVIGRNPVAGDICTVSYNSNNNAIVYRYTSGSYPWVLQTTYITGSLIVENTITADKISASTVFTNALQVGVSGNLPQISGNTMTGAGAYLYSDGRFALGNPDGNIVYNGSQAYLNGFTSGNFTTYGIQNIFSGTTYLGNFVFTKSGYTMVSVQGSVAARSFSTTAFGAWRYVTLDLYAVVEDLTSSISIPNNVMQFKSAGSFALIYSPPTSGSPAVWDQEYRVAMDGSTVVYLPPGTYTVKVYGYGNVYDASGNLLGFVNTVLNNNTSELKISLLQVAV